MRINNALERLLRYLILFFLASGSLNLIYSLVTIPTIKAVLAVIKSQHPDAALLANTISFGNTEIILIPACIAGAAYYFLFILNLTTPMPIKKRILSLLFLLLSFFSLNVSRIAFFSYLAVSGNYFFNAAHFFTWYLGSTIILILLWFAAVYSFKIKSIPVYTDIKAILKDMKRRRK